jgi:methylglyoxal reductase
VQAVRLGASSVSISRVIHGCMGFGPASEAEIIRTMHAAFDAGVTSFDTAPLYGFGASEEALGKAIADRRDRVQLLTKAGLRWDSEHGRVLFAMPDGRVVRKDSRPASLREEVERSLRRLRVEVIDLLQIHHPDPDTPLADSLGALAELVRAGKVRAVGVSNVSVAQAEAAVAALGACPLASLQLEYNLLQRGIERDLLPWARARNVAVLAYSPLAQGVLAGRMLGGAAPPADWRSGVPYFSPANLALVNPALARTAQPLAQAHGVGLGTLSLAWLLAQPGLSAVIAGARTPAHARDSAAAASVTLADDEQARLGAAFPGIDLSPPRPALADRALGKVQSVLKRLLG